TIGLHRTGTRGKENPRVTQATGKGQSLSIRTWPSPGDALGSEMKDATEPFAHLGVSLVMLPLLIVLALTQDRPSPEWMPVLDAAKNLSHVLTIPPPANP